MSAHDNISKAQFATGPLSSNKVGQLKMFMDPEEITSSMRLGDAVSSGMAPDEMLGVKLEESKMEGYDTREGNRPLYDRIAESGVEKPITIKHGMTAHWKPELQMNNETAVLDGHHRLAVALDQKRMVPVQHVDFLNSYRLEEL